MSVTIHVRSGAVQTEASKLTFDGTQRVVIGRGAGADIRLPDPSVSHRHSVVQAKGAAFEITDEGSTNGTFVDGIKLAPKTSRLLRSGSQVRVGRVWLEIRIGQDGPTRDVGNATRDLALMLVSGAMAQLGESTGPRIRVVEGRDQGAVLNLTDDAHPYLIGRADSCDLALSDVDVSREHLEVARRGSHIQLRDLGSRNGAVVAGQPVPRDTEMTWRPGDALRVGGTVLLLEDPLREVLAELEDAPDEPLGKDQLFPPPGQTDASEGGGPSRPDGARPSVGPTASIPANGSLATRNRSGGWTSFDRIVLLLALVLMVGSLSVLYILLKS